MPRLSALAGGAGGRAGLFLYFDVVGHGDNVGSYVERGLDAEADLRRGAVALEAADEVLQRIDAVLAEHAVKVRGHSQRHRGGLLLRHGILVRTLALRKLAVVDVENPVHRGEGGVALSGILDVDVHIHVHGHLLAQKRRGERQHVAGRDIAIGDFLDVDTGNLQVGNVLEVVLAIDKIGKAGCLIQSGLKHVAGTK